MPGKPTKTQDVYNALALEIAQGRLPPGTPLDETRVADRYRVSRTPIREAIRLLEMTGLVESRPHRGALVKRITEMELDEMFSVMAELEATSARWASAAMTSAERRALQTIHDQSAPLVKAGDRVGYAAANDRFHAAVYQGAHNEYLNQLTLTVRRRVAPFRRAQFEESGRLERSFAEHGAVVEAIHRGDGTSAYEAMRAHISVVRTAVESVTETPEPLSPRDFVRPAMAVVLPESE